MTAGSGHSCGLRTNATIACWGDWRDGRLDAPDGTFTAISTAGNHSCALRTNATIACWGANKSGQTDAPAGTYIAVAAGLRHSCALRGDHTVTCWGAIATDLRGNKRHMTVTRNSNSRTGCSWWAHLAGRPGGRDGIAGGDARRRRWG